MREYIRKLLLNKSVILSGSPHGSSWIFDNRALIHSASPPHLEWIADSLWNGFLGLGVSNPSAIVTKGNGGYILAYLVKQSAHRISGVNIPLLLVRDSRKSSGLRKVIEGDVPESFAQGEALFVDDLIHFGATVRSAQKQLTNEGYPLLITSIACIVDFWRGSRSMKSAGKNVVSLFTRPGLGLTRHDPTAPSLGKLNWHIRSANNQNNPNMPIKGSPTIHGEYLSFGMDNHERLLVRKLTGEEAWRYSPPIAKYKGDVCSAVTVGDDLVWTSYDGCLVRADLDTGVVKQRLRLDEQMHSSPTLDGARMFIGTERNDYSFYVAKGDIRCLDAATGAELWSQPTNGMIPGNCSYEAQTSTVVCGSNDLHVYVLDADTGAIRFKIATSGEVKGSAVFGGEAGICFAMTVDGWVYRINVLTGQIEWSKRAGASAKLPTPVVFDSMVIVYSEQNQVVGMSPETGEIQWIRTVRGYVSQKAVRLDDNRILALTSTGYVYIIDVATGEKIAASRIADARIHQPAAIEDGRVYIATDNSGVFCYDIA